MSGYRRSRSLSFVLGLAFLVSAQASSKRTYAQDPFATPKSRGFRTPTPSAAAPPPRPRLHFVEAWRVPLGSPLSGPLLPVGDRVYAGLESGVMAAVSIEEGKLLWRTDPGPPPIGGPLQFRDRVVLVSASGKISAWDPLTGAPAWTADVGEAIARPPVATLDAIFIPLVSGRLVALGPEGAPQWSAPLDSPPSISPAACRGLVLIGTEKGSLQAFERAEGRSLWSLALGSPARSSLLCYRGMIYFGTADHRLFAVRYRGRRAWAYPAGAQTTARPLGLGRDVLFLSYDNNLYLLQAGSGNLEHKVRLSHRLSEDALLFSDRLYLSPYTSARLAAYDWPALTNLGEYHLELEGDWFTTPPIRTGGRLLIGYGRYEGRILALREEEAPPPEVTP